MPQKEAAEEVVLEIEKKNFSVGEMDQGAVTLIVDSAEKKIGKVQLDTACVWAMHFGFPQRNLRVLSAPEKGDL